MKNRCLCGNHLKQVIISNSILKSSAPFPNLLLVGIPIKFLSSHENFVIVFSQKLSWKSHIYQIAQRTTCTYSNPRILSMVESGLDGISGSRISHCYNKFKWIYPLQCRQYFLLNVIQTQNQVTFCTSQNASLSFTPGTVDNFPIILCHTWQFAACISAVFFCYTFKKEAEATTV